MMYEVSQRPSRCPQKRILESGTTERPICTAIPRATASGSVSSGSCRMGGHSGSGFRTTRSLLGFLFLPSPRCLFGVSSVALPRASFSFAFVSDKGLSTHCPPILPFFTRIPSRAGGGAVAVERCGDWLPRRARQQVIFLQAGRGLVCQCQCVRRHVRVFCQSYDDVISPLGCCAKEKAADRTNDVLGYEKRTRPIHKAGSCPIVLSVFHGMARAVAKYTTLLELCDPRC